MINRKMSVCYVLFKAKIDGYSGANVKLFVLVREW
jgi:hypothetical protein